MKPLFRSISILMMTIVLGHAVAQDTYTSKPVRIVVPFPPGGGTDTLARELAQQLSQRWKVPVIVDNRPGAAGQIGTEAVARSAPDGRTLLLTTTHLAINASLQKNLPYDARKDFTPLALIASVSNAIVVRPDHPAKTLAQLIQMAKQEPGRLSFGSTGIGGSTHLAGELLKSMAGIDMVHVAYKGSAPALSDVLGGHLPVHIDTVNGVLEHYKAGRIRILAVTGPNRLRWLPDVPTVAEAASLKDYQATGWFALFGPAKLPANVTSAISQAVLEELNSDVLKQRIAGQGADTGNMTQQQFSVFFDQEVEKWAGIIASAKIRAE